MNSGEFRGKWEYMKRGIREHWGKFTPQELANINGEYDQFLSKLQEKYGYTRQQAEQELQNWQDSRRKKTAAEQPTRKFWSEESPSSLASHERLANSDKNPSYPLEPIDQKRNSAPSNRKKKKRTSRG